MPAVWCEQRDGRGHRPSFLARSCSGIFFLFSFFLKRILSRKARGSCEPAFIRRRATRRLSCLRCCGAPTAGTSATGHLVLGQNSTLLNFTERSRRTSAFLLDFHPLSAPAPSWLHLPAQGIVSLSTAFTSRRAAQHSRADRDTFPLVRIAHSCMSMATSRTNLDVGHLASGLLELNCPSAASIQLLIPNWSPADRPAA